MPAQSIILFADRRYYLDKSTGYYRSHVRSEGRDYLHRDVWRSVYGNIPHGWQVHHKVPDTGTLDADDLECLPPLEHNARHVEQNRRNGLLTIHHTRRRLDLVCDWCGTAYRGVRGRWCSRKCGDAFHNANQAHRAGKRSTP